MTLAAPPPRPTILVVDDTPENIDILGRILQPDYRVRVATDGPKALAIVESDDPPDLVLLDVMMPGINGFEVCRRIKANPARAAVPVLFVTALGEVESEQQGLEIGAIDYITKPVTAAVVLARVRNHLELKLARERLARQNEELERRVAERTADLQRAKALLEAQSEASIDGILIVGRDGRAVWANRRFGEQWSIPVAGLAGRAESDLLAGVRETIVDAEAVDRFRARMAAVPGDTGRAEVHLKRGTAFDVYTGPVRAADGGLLGRLWLFRDVTEERRLQASVAQSDRLASMGMLAAGVAHEINNPLTYVLYNLESLAGDAARLQAEAAAVREALAARLGEDGLAAAIGPHRDLLDAAFFTDVLDRFTDAVGGTRRIKEIAKGLGTFSRVEKDQFVPVDVRGPLEAALQIAHNAVKYRARVVREFAAAESVLASEGKLSQIFLNLIINASHAIAEGDVAHNAVTVRIRQEGAHVVVEIEDTGSGIAPENLERIFEPFFTTKPVGVGSGLGLNIVKNLVTGFGGTIGVTSAVGKGTCFRITLPVARAAVESADAAEAAPAAARPGRVLAVDDDPGIRAVVRKVLAGHTVVEADSGAAAQAILARDAAFDAVVCDVIMPTLTGTQLHAWLAEHHPALAARLIFVSGGAFTPSTREYLEKVDNPRLEKPFDAALLQRLVAERVNRA